METGVKFELKLVDHSSVVKALSSMSASKATGIDGVSAKLLKDGATAIAVPITHIMNLSIISGIFPSKWKIAKVTPLFKDGDKSLPENYRPISILPALGKILEKFVHEQLYSFFLSE